MSAFKEKALAVVRRIPPGRTLSYAEVARRAGFPGAARAVGGLMKSNRDPGVPCHRVIRSDGDLGDYNRGRAEKHRLLKQEAADAILSQLGQNRTRVLGAGFFDRPTLKVARELLGKFLVRRIGRRRIAAMITETEAYDGFGDMASHASRGQTPRNAPMFGGPGHWYVYFTYGMHWMLNAVTGREGYPAAVLLRAAIDPKMSQLGQNWNGPAKLTRGLRIGRAENGRPIARRTGLWIEDRGVRVPDSRIKRAPRVGVDYAGAWAKKPYRFIMKDIL